MVDHKEVKERMVQLVLKVRVSQACCWEMMSAPMKLDWTKTKQLHKNCQLCLL
jgi:hypothetical protein